MRKHRIGSVPYLNARPLTEGLHGVELDVPSRLASRLDAGELDVALVSSFEALRCPDRAVVPGIAIASPGPVGSVLLFLRGPPERARRILLDESSLTSAALVRVLFAERWGASPEFRPCPPEVDPSRADADGVLLIGDPALRASRNGTPSLDLATEWRAMTELPFCFAVWLARDERTAEDLLPLLSAAKERGLARRAEYASEAAAAMGFFEEELVTYLTERITYDLGAGEQAALRRFGDLCRKGELL